MAKYGGYFLLDNGWPFVTPDSIPLRLDSVHVVESRNATASKEIYMDTSKTIIPFLMVETYSTGQPFQKVVIPGYHVGNGKVMISAACYAGRDPGEFRLTCLIFTNAPKPLRQGMYGAAFFDAGGQLVLTNEDRVLTDMMTIGTLGVERHTGIYIDEWRDGRIGIIPGIAGARVGQGHSTAYFATYSEGGRTRVLAALAGSPPPGATGTINAGTVVTCVNFDNYR